MFADVIPSKVDPLLSGAGLVALGAVLLTVMALALGELLRARRLRRDLFKAIRSRGRTVFIGERPPWALPPCDVCGDDACNHLREVPAREGGGVAVEMKLGPDGVARGELTVEC